MGHAGGRGAARLGRAPAGRTVLSAPADASALAARFRRFAAQECHRVAPLYERLATAIADDPDLLDLAAAAPAHQPAPNLLLAAVQDQLLQEIERGAAPPLAAFYPGLGGEPAPADVDPWRPFRAFALARRAALRELLATRIVQTNEVGRCALLLPAFGLAARRARRPLALIEIGAAAGFNLLFDRYGYVYPPAGHVGDRKAAVQLTCRLMGRHRPPLPRRLPAVAWRVGVDLAPIDLGDAAARRWLRALVWPDRADRVRQLAAAIAESRARQPRLVAGDALQALPELLAEAPADAAACVVHSFTLNQWSDSARAALERLLRNQATRRPIVRIAVEYKRRKRPRLELAVYQARQASSRVLAVCSPHGDWIEWREAA